MRVNIIGGGLAGTSLAYILKSRGADPVIYEASLNVAGGASGNEVGLYNPRFSAQLDVVAKFYSDAFFQALEIFKKFDKAINWTPCGVLSLLCDERRDVRYRKTVTSWGWSHDDMQLISAREASEIAGVEIAHDALYLPKSGNISPRNLCHEYTQGVEVHLDHAVKNLADLKGDATILACGIGALKFDATHDLPLKSVRGQVSYIEQGKASKNLKAMLNYNGYIAPAKDGTHVLGATFQPWLSHSEIRPEDNLTNLEKLFEDVPSLKDSYTVIGSRAAVRTASRDHFPVVGQLSKGTYISVAHGSHGILSTIISANILADMILGSGFNVSNDMLAALSPNRFSR